MTLFKISILFFVLWVCSAQNFIQNGDFNYPQVPRNFLADSRANYWTGELFEVYNYGGGLGYGQYLDLQNQKGNGYIQQVVELTYEAYYILSFYRKSSDTNYASHVIEIEWNGMFVARITPQNTNIIKEQIQVLGNHGKNLLKIKQVGVGDDYEGLLIDEITLVKSNNLILKEKVFAISFLASTPLNQFISFKYALLFADDLFLYSYDIVKYKGLLAIIFSTVTTIEVLKFEVLDKFLGWMNNVDDISDTGKRFYAKKAFVNIQGAFKIPVDAFFPYVIYTIPQTILICTIFFFIFHMTKEYKISLLFRKFSFFKTILFKLLIQENIGYFAYICLGNMSELFSFSHSSKWYNLYSVGMLFVLVFYCMTFYMLIGKYLGQRVTYFVDCQFKKEISLMFVSFGLMRSFSRGAIHYFFRGEYASQTASLCIVQAITIAYYAYIQTKHRLFEKKIVFSLALTYHFIFFLFNFVLYLNFKTKLSKTFDPIQQILIYILIGTTISASLFELLPLKKCTRSLAQGQSMVNQQQQEPAFGEQQQKQEVLTKYLAEETHKQPIIMVHERQQKQAQQKLKRAKLDDQINKKVKQDEKAKPLPKRKIKGHKEKKENGDVTLRIENKKDNKSNKKEDFEKENQNVKEQ